METVKKFFDALFGGIDITQVATWLRGLFAALIGGLVTGIIDVLVQFLGALGTQAPFVIDWHLVIRTVAIAVLPLVIAYLKQFTPKQ